MNPRKLSCLLQIYTCYLFEFFHSSSSIVINLQAFFACCSSTSVLYMKAWLAPYQNYWNFAVLFVWYNIKYFIFASAFYSFSKAQLVLVRIFFIFTWWTKSCTRGIFRIFALTFKPFLDDLYLGYLLWHHLLLLTGYKKSNICVSWSLFLKRTYFHRWVDRSLPAHY